MFDFDHRWGDKLSNFSNFSKLGSSLIRTHANTPCKQISPTQFVLQLVNNNIERTNTVTACYANTLSLRFSFKK